MTAAGNDELQKHFPRRKGTILKVRTADSEFVVTVPDRRGAPASPLSVAEVRAKFEALAGEVLDPSGTAHLWSLCMGIDQQPDLGEVFALLGTHR